MREGTAALIRRIFGQPWIEATVDAAQAAIDTDYTPLSDMRASAAYRSLAARNMLRKVFIETTSPGVTARVEPESALPEKIHG